MKLGSQRDDEWVAAGHDGEGICWREWLASRITTAGVAEAGEGGRQAGATAVVWVGEALSNVRQRKGYHERGREREQGKMSERVVLVGNARGPSGTFQALDRK